MQERMSRQYRTLALQGQLSSVETQTLWTRCERRVPLVQSWSALCWLLKLPSKQILTGTVESPPALCVPTRVYVIVPTILHLWRIPGQTLKFCRVECRSQSLCECSYFRVDLNARTQTHTHTHARARAHTRTRMHNNSKAIFSDLWGPWT